MNSANIGMLNSRSCTCQNKKSTKNVVCSDNKQPLIDSKKNESNYFPEYGEISKDGKYNIENNSSSVSSNADNKSNKAVISDYPRFTGTKDNVSYGDGLFIGKGEEIDLVETSSSDSSNDVEATNKSACRKCVGVTAKVLAVSIPVTVPVATAGVATFLTSSSFIDVLSTSWETISTIVPGATGVATGGLIVLAGLGILGGISYGCYRLAKKI